MSKISASISLAALAVGLAMTGQAYAGACASVWITEGVTRYHGAPSGPGDPACQASLYNQFLKYGRDGSLSHDAVMAAIQQYWSIHRSMVQGPGSNYSFVQFGAHMVPMASLGSYRAVTANGGTVYIVAAQSWVVSQGGGNVVSQGGGNLTGQLDMLPRGTMMTMANGARVIASGGGNVVSQGGGN